MGETDALLDRIHELIAEKQLASRFRPPAAPSEILAFERFIGIELPDEYQRFLLEVGNGSFESIGWSKYLSLGKYVIERPQGQGVVVDLWGAVEGDPAQPFKHTADWDSPVDIKDCDRVEDPTLLNGALPISDSGCNYFEWLVVTGPQRGEVWADGRTSDLGLRRMCDKNGKPLSFLEFVLREILRS